MKYIFLVYRDEKQWQAMPTQERDSLENARMANEQDMRQSGHLLAVEGLQSSNSAIRVWIENGKVSLTAGPFAEMQGQLFQIFFIQARDLNEAIRVASKMPQTRSGLIEVRPVRPRLTK